MLDQLNPILRGATTAERFIILAIAAMLDPHELEAVLTQLNGESANFERTVAGHSLVHWVGKTRAQVRAEAGNKAHEVEKAFAASGLRFSDPEMPPGVNRLRQVSTPSTGVVEVKAAQTGAVATGRDSDPETPADDKNDDSEPTAQGFKYSELAELTDDQLLEMDGIGKATVEKIRQWQANQTKPADGAEDDETPETKTSETENSDSGNR